MQTPRVVEVYKFKAPAFLKKLTNTYFKGSQIHDLQDLKRKINTLKRRYRSKNTRMSFDLEVYMHEKQKGHMPQEHVPTTEQQLGVTHMSMTSHGQLKRLGDKFLSENLPQQAAYR